MGVVTIKQRKTCDSRINNRNASATNYLRDTFFVKANAKLDNVIVSEVAQIYHAVKHNHSNIPLTAAKN